MSDDDLGSPKQEAVWIFYETVIDELRIDTDKLENQYGVEHDQHYSYDAEKHELVEVTDEDFLLFNRLRRTFSNNCTCQQYEAAYERFDTEIGAVRPVSKDGTWLSSSEVEDTLLDRAADGMIDYMERDIQNRLKDRLYEVMLVAHGLSHIAEVPRSGAHFIKGWAHPFSDDWYDAEILDLLGSCTFEEVDETSNLVALMTKAYRIGRARSDQIWRKKHFKTSQSGAKQASNLKTATLRMSDAASKRNREKLHNIQKLWMVICEGNQVLSRNDSRAADAIFDHLRLNKGDHSLRSLRIKKTGAPIGQDAIRRHLKELRTVGRI